MSSKKYIQIDVRKDNNVDTAWVEMKPKLEVGKFIDIKLADGTYDEDWLVEKIYDNAIKNEEQIMLSRDTYRYHRKAIDI